MAGWQRFGPVGVFVLVSVAYAAGSAAVERGWLPVVALAGERDPVRAVRTLREVSAAWGVVLRNREVDASTREFLERATGSLHDFNLKRLYELLPERDGLHHQLSVTAGVAGDKYVIGRAEDPQFAVGPSGPRQNAGDASLVLRALPVATHDGDTNYLLQGRAGVVIAPVSWAAVSDGAQLFLRLLSSAPAEQSARPMVASRQTILSHNPRLGPEDVEPLATLWEAFPRLGNLLTALGGVDDLVAEPVVSIPDVQHLRALLHLDPVRMKPRFPRLAAYLRGLDKLLEADVRWVDAQGRTFATLHVASRDLSARLEVYTKDGLLVPWRGDTVLADQPLAAGSGMFRYSVRASASFRMLGVGSQMRSARVDFEHDRTARGLELRVKMTQVPTITVHGAALGIVPTGVIDLFIPGDIQGLIEKSLATACHGNGGRGMVIDVRYDRRPEGRATLDGELVLEAIDNFLVKLGFGYFTDHILPDDHVREDISQLMNELHAGFTADLERYARGYSAPH
jgi:hypothetical protein